MKAAFLSACRWFLIASGAVAGTSAFIISNDTGSTNPIIIGVFAYGFIYIYSYFWREFRGKLLLGGVLTFLLVGFLQDFVPDAVYIATGSRMAPMNPYFLWWILEAAIGIPLMTIVFKIWGD